MIIIIIMLTIGQLMSQLAVVGDRKDTQLSKLCPDSLVQLE